MLQTHNYIHVNKNQKSPIKASHDLNKIANEINIETISYLRFSCNLFLSRYHLKFTEKKKSNQEII